MRHITKPNIPESEPDIKLHDEKRGDIRKYLEDCYDYLESKGIKIYGRMDCDDYDCKRVINSLNEEIGEREHEIKEIEKEEKKAPVPYLESFEYIKDELRDMQSQMCTMDHLRAFTERVELLSQILNKHTDDIAKLRKENENETTS